MAKYKKPANPPRIVMEDRWLMDGDKYTASLPHLILIWEDRECWHFIAETEREVQEFAATIHVLGVRDGRLWVAYGVSYPKVNFISFRPAEEIAYDRPEQRNWTPSVSKYMDH